VLAQQLGGSNYALATVLAAIILAQCFFVFVLLGRDCACRLQVVTLLAFFPFLCSQFAWLSTENIANLPNTMLLFLAHHRPRSSRRASLTSVAAGALAAVAFNVRPHTVLFALPFLVVRLASTDLSRGDKIKNLATFAAGGVAVQVAALSALWWNGRWDALSGYCYVLFRYSAGYVQAANPHLLLHWLGMSATSNFGLIIFVCLVLSLASPSRKQLALFWIIGFIVILAPMKPYTHYISSIIPVVAYSILKSLSEGTSSITLIRTPLAVAFVLYMLLMSLFTASRGFTRRHEKQRLDLLAAAITAHSSSSDTLYATGSDTPYLYFITKMKPATPYFADFWLNAYHRQILPTPADQIVRDLMLRPPSIIVRRTASALDPSHSSKLVDALLHDNKYRIVGELYGFQIYQMP
jgi:hypothetical protein